MRIATEQQPTGYRIVKSADGIIAMNARGSSSVKNAVDLSVRNAMKKLTITSISAICAAMPFVLLKEFPSRSRPAWRVLSNLFPAFSLCTITVLV